MYGGAAALSKYFHLAYTVNRATLEAKLYVDGILEDVEPITNNCTFYSMTQMSIAKTPFGSNPQARGCFAGLKIFKSALTAEDIADVKGADPYPIQVEPKMCNNDISSILLDTYWTASSYLSDGTYDWKPENAKTLHGSFSAPSACCWQPSTPSGSWLQIMMPQRGYRLSGITTMGSSDTSISPGYVKTFKIQYADRSGGHVTWHDYTWPYTSFGFSAGDARIFKSDISATYNKLLPELETGMLRIIPQTWQTAPILRVKLHGCHGNCYFCLVFLKC